MLLTECVSSPPAFTGLPDRIRVTLCVFMCTLLIVNPFNMLIRSSLSSGSDDTLKSHGGPSRTLQAQEPGQKYIVCLINTAVGLGVNCNFNQSIN